MMSHPFRRTARSWTALMVSAGMLLVVSSAHAGYTVIDDDLLPTVFTEVAVPAHHLVSFPKNGSSLSDAGRNMLDAMLPMMRGASIRVVGRPDAMVYSRGKLAMLASNRANSIRNYLARQGIPFESITVEVDSSANPQRSGSIYPSDIYVTKSSDRAIARMPQSVALAASQAYVGTSSFAAPQRPASPSTSLPAAASGTARERLIHYINQAVISGQMDPAVALKLLRTQMESERLETALQAAPTPAQQWRSEMQAAVTPQYAPAPVPAARVGTWVLDKRLSLRENVDAWSRLAGWAPSAWEASGAFQITANSNVTGDFPGVLRQIADSTGLNICAKTREKYVRVTDANVSCK